MVSKNVLLYSGVPSILRLYLQWYCMLIILPANSMTTQLQELWTLYYIRTHYSSILFRSLRYYRPGLIILTRK